jgi:hypothetical protein
MAALTMRIAKAIIAMRWAWLVSSVAVRMTVQTLEYRHQPRSQARRQNLPAVSINVMFTFQIRCLASQFGMVDVKKRFGRVANYGGCNRPHWLLKPFAVEAIPGLIISADVFTQVWMRCGIR